MRKIQTNIIRIISIIIFIFISYLISQGIKSTKAINAVLEKGFEVIKKYTTLEEIDIGEYKKITIMKIFPFYTKSYKIENEDILQYYHATLDFYKYLVFI